nr:MAG TPA: hypothetical protein [Caudoviricetes sp.]DAS26251.1 MAG TPA: hypothetical protein [Caudoviricetes sp.]
MRAFFVRVLSVVSYPRAGWLMPRRRLMRLLNSGKDEATFLFTV